VPIPIDPTDNPSIGRKFPERESKREAYAEVPSAVAQFCIMIFLESVSGLGVGKADRAYRRFVEELDNVTVGVANIK